MEIGRPVTQGAWTLRANPASVVNPMKPSTELVSVLNSIKLNQEDLFEAINVATDAYEKGDCHMMTGVITTMELFAAAPDKAKAVIFRLQALGLVMETDQLNSWIQADGIRVQFCIMPLWLLPRSIPFPSLMAIFCLSGNHSSGEFSN
jgi:hypothetical protein